MEIINHINTSFSDANVLSDQFSSAKPDPLIVLDNFLPTSSAEKMFVESISLSPQLWTEFTRNNSHMKECTKLEVMPEAYNLVSALHSQMFLKWLESVTNITGLIPDPFLIGAGYSKSFKNDILNVHTDFNWNDQLRLHRALSLIVYLTPDWNIEWGGNLNFYDHNNQEVISSISCLFNRCVIWKYHKRGFHSVDKITCPDAVQRTTFRVFYYQSGAEYDVNDRPHRSLYWYDKELNEPYDIPTKK